MGKHIFITGYYGFGNTGDEAILTAIIAHLRAADPALRITTTSAEPEQTASTFGVEAILWSDMLAMLEAVRSADLILIGGGGIFHDYWGFNPQAFLTDNQWGIGFYTAPAVLGSLYGKPVMLYAVGVGPLLSDQGRRFTKVACDAAQRITVRDDGSKTLLETLGVDGGKVEVTADPAFGFPLQELKAKSTPGKIGVALRHWDVGVHPSFVEGEIAQALDLFLRNNPNEVEFIPFQLLTNREDDLAVAHRVHGLMQQKDRATVLDQPLSPAALLERMSSYNLVVGMRLHSVIFGLLAGVPVVALSYDPKVEQVMAQMGLQAFSLDVRSIEAAGLAARMRESLEDGPVSRERTQALRELAVRNAAIALEILRQPEPQPIGGDALTLIRRGVEAQLGDTAKFRKESQRLLKEAEFYINELSQAKATLAERETILVVQRNEYATRVEAQESRVKELEQAKTNLQQECDGLKNRVRDLASELSQVSDASRSLEQSLESIRANFARAETQLQSIEAKLRAGDAIRSKAVKALDRFTDKFQETNILYRNQKAWQVMLLLRKAYTLLFRHGTSDFLQWVLSWPFAGFGDLAEYDLQFPQVWNYMPEGLEKPLLPDVSVENAATAEVKESAPRTVAELLPQQKYDVVIMAIFDFDFRFQRPQQIAAQFARTGHRVFWVSPGRFLPSGDSKPYEAIPLRENMWEVHLRGTRPELYTGSLPADTAQSIHASLKELYKDYGIAESCAILQFPFWRQVGLNLRSEFGARVVYDCMDDWQNWTAEPRISDWNLEQERLLTREADVLVVTSQEFLERHQANGLHPVLARNAADFDFFATPRANDLIKDKSRPIVGYYGAIADWFDLDLVTRLAESRPQYNFILIGQVHGVDTSKLAALPNVSMPGEKNYREIPLYLSHFDVCLIPFVLNKLTKGVDPVKMYEYFSQGKPVVATEMAELAQSTDLLYIGRTFEEFAANVDRAIAEQDQEVRRRRIDYARANTWAARVDTIDAAVQKSFPKVSILIVTYNGEEFLEPCFESIERNTAWPNYEVIVVDNNSNATTRQILSKMPGRITSASSF